MDKNQKTEETGLRVVRKVVREGWLSNLQEISHQNDDGIDAIIFLKKKNVDTGGVVNIQIKCGSTYRKKIKKYAGNICVHLGRKYISRHRGRWLRSNIPVVLIYVDPSKNINKPNAWWVNLNSPDSFAKSNRNIILIPQYQVFGDHSKGDFLKLSGVKSLPYIIPQINMENNEVSIFKLSESIKKQARIFYKTWASSKPRERTHKILGEITINRIGWRHISRNGRRAERIIQSWLLLPCAKKIICETDNFSRLGKANCREGYDSRSGKNCFKITDYVGLRAKINFPHRDKSIIQVVLKRCRIVAKNDSQILFHRIWFYSVYEKRAAI